MRVKILSLKSQEVWVKEVIKNLSEYRRQRPLAKPSKRIAPLLLSLLWLGAIASVAFLWHLGNIGLVDETEPLFAEAARQMTVTGDWITPYFNGETRFDKPPLIYWLMAAAYRTLGVNEWAVRLPSALCAIALTCLGFYTLSKTEGSSATDSVADVADVADVTENSEGIFSPSPTPPLS
ncbi:glycosyltransferase family 39 protein, partial [Microcoleus sp. LEGE 07076]|uniref:ArnT family glycosyltransferase n=1 Tax=Microcoleus sp. LEGE 07076 TaxID=915322 RepID=UPI001D153EB4